MRGIVLEGKKDASLVSWTVRRVPQPARVRIFLDGAEPCVEAGRRVLAGETIGRAAGRSGVDVHASVSGRVVALAPCPHPNGGEARAVEIEADRDEQRLPEIGKERQGWETLPVETLERLFRENGLVDAARAVTPVHEKIAASRVSRASVLIVNGCESEPYLTADQALMTSHPLEILKGAEILRRASGAERVVIAVESNKIEAAELFKSKIFFLKWQHADVRVFPAVYPQDDETLLAQAAAEPGANAVVFGAATAFAAYEAVVYQKPFYERVVTVGGECVIEPRNFWARLGTDFGALVKSARGILREPGRMLAGGPMRGVAQASWDVPTTKATPAVLALPKEVTYQGLPSAPGAPTTAGQEYAVPVPACIRCAKCVDACPVDISPVMISLAVERGLFDLASEYRSELCIGCGNCSYVCPSKRPMLELVQAAAFFHAPEKKQVRPAFAAARRPLALELA